VLAAERKRWKAVAADISPAALAVARENCPAAIALLRADRFSAFKKPAAFDFIVTNPPYIPSAVCAGLPRSVRCFEPVGALDGGADGLDFYRYLAAAAPPLLGTGGRIYCEIGFDQGASAPRLFAGRGWRDVSVTNDLGGRPRVVRAVRPQEE
jgi:release factor glutamine methyltransferase